MYNASHLLGFFSTFNSDAIKDVSIYKGGMPARYGGRLFSLPDNRAFPVLNNRGNEFQPYKEQILIFALTILPFIVGYIIHHSTHSEKEPELISPANVNTAYIY